MRKILCVCSANMRRSPMMAAYLARMLGSGFQVDSSGTYDGLKSLPLGEGAPAAELIIRCMFERGFDISDHKTCHVSQLNLKQYELIICVNAWVLDEMRCWFKDTIPRLVIANQDGGGIFDPSIDPGPANDKERELVIAQIERSMREIADRLLT